MISSKHIYSTKNLISMNYRLQNHTQLFSAILLVFVLLCSSATLFAQEDEEVEFTQGDATTEIKTTNDDPIKLFYKAQESHSKGNLKLALELYDKALAANPEFPEAEFQRGTIFLNWGENANAEKAFRRAVDLRRDWTLPMSQLGALLVQRGEYLEAEEFLNKAIRIDGMSFPAYVALTELKILTKASQAELKLLLGKLQYLTTKSKIPASIWASRAAIERTLDDKDAAKISIKRALLIDDNNQYALEESIEIALIEGDTEGALKNSKNLLAISPNSTNVKVLLARSYHSDGNTKEAIKILDTIENPTKYVSNLKSQLTVGGSRDITTLEKMLKDDEKNIAILSRLCIVSRLKEPKKALKYCQRASLLEPKEISHAIGFGAALVIEKRYGDAVNLFRKLLEISPENYTIRANLATALFQLNRFKEAKVEYEWITRTQPKLAVGYYFLAISHDRLSEYLDAMANYQQFLKLADDSLKLEVEKVNLRIPSLNKQIKRGKGKKRR